MRDERGAIAIIVAATTVALIGTLMIVVDVGMLYQQRRQLQTAVDSAALAGAMEIAEGRSQSEAQSVVESYVNENGGTASAISTTIDFPSPTSVRVSAAVDRDLFFARLFGRTAAGVTARATADFGLATSVRNLVPVIVPEQAVADHVGPANTTTFEFGEDRPAEQGGGSGSPGGSTPQLGYFWLTDFDAGSGGVPPYDEWIRNGYPEEVSIGFLVNGTGMKNSLRDAVEWRMANHPKVVLPLFDYTEGGGHGGAYHVVGFAEFVITGTDFHGNPKGLTGYFTTGTVAAGSSGAGSPPAHGVTTIWLSQ